MDAGPVQPGKLLEAGPGVWSIEIPMPISHNPRVFAYVVRDEAGDFHLIDSGLPRAAGLEALTAGLAELGLNLADIRTVTVTHFHHDHLGLADTVRAAGGARVAVHRLDAEAMGKLRGVTDDELARWVVPAEGAAELRSIEVAAPPDMTPDLLLEDGDRLAIPGREFIVVHTPGHTSGHICVVSRTDRLLFTGDHLLPDQFPGVGLGGESANPLADYYRSLDRIREFDGYRGLPGHGWAFDQVGERIDQSEAHHRRRTTEIGGLIADHPDATVWEIAQRVSWTAGWDGLQGFYRLSALRQTESHMAVARGEQ